MKTKVTFKSLLVAGILLLCATNSKAGDVNLHIPETSVNNLFETLVHSKWLNYGSVGYDEVISYYSVKMNSVSVQVQPDNQFYFNFDLKAYANFNIGPFRSDETSNGVLSGSGTITLVPVGNGYKITFDLETINYSAEDWYADLLDFSLQLFKSNIPEISTSSEQPFLPNTVSSFFTSATPTLTTTNSEIILSYNLAVGPRYITVYNEVNGDQSIGSVENTTPGEENMFSSPHTFEWNTGSQKSIRTPDEVLEPQSQSYYKYQNWYEESISQKQNEISTREIQINVGNNDQNYKAFFEDAVRIQASNLLEGTNNGGSLTFDGETENNDIDTYRFKEGISKTLSTSPPSSGSISYNFISWASGNTNPSQSVSLGSNFQTTAYYKAKNHSIQSDVIQNDNRRQVIEDISSQYVFRVYESTGIPATDKSGIWIQVRQPNSNTWGNEFQMIKPYGNSYSVEVRNPRLAMSSGKMFIIYEAKDGGNYDPGLHDWHVVVTSIANPQSGGTSYKHLSLIDPTGQDYLRYADNLAVYGEMSGSNYSVGIAYKRYSSSDLRALFVKESGNNLVQYNVSGNLPYYVSIGSAIDVALYNGKLGIVFAGSNTIQYREAMFTGTSAYWNSPYYNLSYPYYNLDKNPSIIPWNTAFRIAFTGRINNYGSLYQVIAWKDVGSGVYGSPTYYIYNDYIDAHVGNYFDGVQLAKLSTSANPYSSGTMSVTTNYVRFGTSYLKVFNIYGQGNFSLPTITATSGVNTKSVSPLSSTNKNQGVYRSVSTNQGMYKLNEIQSPTGPSKVAISDEFKKGFETGVIHYKTMAGKDNQLFIHHFKTKEEVIDFKITEDSTGYYLSDWFTFKKKVLIKGFINDKGRLPFSLALVNREGDVWDKVRFRGNGEISFYEMDKRTLRMNIKRIGVLKFETEDDVRIKLLPFNSAEYPVIPSIALVPVKQELTTQGERIDEFEDIPDQVEVIKAYPNPFNPSTIISVKLDQDSKVKMEVFDINGRLVANLLNGSKNSGLHQVTFNATNLSSGIYFVRTLIQSSNGSSELINTKVTLIK